MNRQNARLSDRTAVLILIGACLLLLLQAAVLMRTRWVEDESWLADGAWALLQDGALRMPIFPADTRFKTDVSLPLERLTMAPVFSAFGLGEVQGRSVSALAAIAAVIVVFLLTRRLLGSACAAMAAVLLASDTFLVIAARTVRPEAEATFLCWLSLLLADLALHRESGKLALCAGVTAGLSVLCHPMGVAFVVAITLYCIHEKGWKLWTTSVFRTFAAGLSAVIALYLAWCFSDATHIANFRNVYLSKMEEPLRLRLTGELDRWKDFAGYGSQRVPLPVNVPVRIHIVCAIVAAFLYLRRLRPGLARCLFALLLVNAAWWLYMVNKGPRYITVVAPVFAIALASAVAFSRGRVRIWWVAIAALVLVSQLAGNAYWIYKFRHADYPSVTRALRAAIPAGASVYSVTTFWLALHDRTYYAYDRTPFEYARETLKPEYIILNDRVMVHGSGHGEDEFRSLREQATLLVRERGTLISRIANDFYGDLEIYRVSW